MSQMQMDSKTQGMYRENIINHDNNYTLYQRNQRDDALIERLLYLKQIWNMAAVRRDSELARPETRLIRVWLISELPVKAALPLNCCVPN